MFTSLSLFFLSSFCSLSYHGFHACVIFCLLKLILLYVVLSFLSFSISAARIKQLSVPKFIANLHCSCSSMDLRYAQEDAVYTIGKFCDTQYIIVRTTAPNNLVLFLDVHVANSNRYV